ncbi:hypothetical protein LTR62_001791 [Meristemomyces frigidus]|uniref:Short chain dehydrogenase n=1 Tax=Meristemomyces frigidus TaxID=1508187 RepID=A0AAN7TTK3_9PEZI|nr:hypothetical protein LTR62_001791 [Meristemomyces frigidus]
MARILITGSTDGIGAAAAQLLVSRGHQVTLHARNETRANDTLTTVPGAKGVLIGDLTTIAGTKELAVKAQEAGPWDSIIHNAGLGPSNPYLKTADGFASTFAVNSLAPYILTSLLSKPQRLLYLSSSLHSGGDASLEDVAWQNRPFDSFQAYSDSKLHDVLLANAVARRWGDVQACSLDPGWVKTKVGGIGAPGGIEGPAEAIAEFASGGGGFSGMGSGVYLGVGGSKTAHKAASDVGKQDAFVKICEELSGVKLPA